MGKLIIMKIITKEYLKENPNHIFVFGDNTIRKGKAGGAILRDEPNSYGFITKKFPNNKDESFYKPDEYRSIFVKELIKLKRMIKLFPEKTFLISKIGSGLANRFGIFGLILFHSRASPVFNNAYTFGLTIPISSAIV